MSVYSGPYSETHVYLNKQEPYAILHVQCRSLDVVSKQEPSATNQSPVGLASLLQEQKDK